MHIDWWTLALQTINVVVLIWLLSRFLYRPVLAAIAARQAAAAKVLADAEARRQEAAAEAEALKRRTDELAAREAELIAQARTQADAERAALLKAATEETAKLRAQARTDLERDAASARRRLEGDAVELAAAMARKLLSRAPAQPVTEAMFADLLARLRALPAPEREKLIAPDASIRVTTAGALGEADRARYAAALREALPGLGALAFQVDPELVAGFELAGPNLVVTNSWRADLAEVCAALVPAEASDHVA